MIELEGPMFEESASLQEDVEKTDVVASSALTAAESIADVARGTARVLTGAYKAGIGAEPWVSHRGVHGARVIARDRKSAWEEFGEPGINVAPTFNLRNAAVSLGFEFIKHGE